MALDDLLQTISDASDTASEVADSYNSVKDSFLGLNSPITAPVAPTQPAQAPIIIVRSPGQGRLMQWVSANPILAIATGFGLIWAARKLL